MNLRLAFILLLVSWMASAQPIVRVGAKHFNEGYILSEIIAQVLENEGYRVDRRFNLGGTTVCFDALRTGGIDVYPEYTGTLAKEILKTAATQSIAQLNSLTSSRYGIGLSDSFGFSNSYGLLIRKETAVRLGLQTLSDLARHPELRFGLSYEFLHREDGWPNLARTYGFTQKAIGLEHGIAYHAILDNQIDVTDAYTTDGEIRKYNLNLLNDDLRFFPDYEAVCLYSQSLPDKVKLRLHSLAGILSEGEMQQLNAMALFENKPHQEIARNFLVQRGLIRDSAPTEKSMIGKVMEKSWQHLQLSFLALVASMLIALPLGLLIFRHRHLARIVLYVTGILQTIPSIALLALLIPLSGIGATTSVIALFLYALLPILRNTVIGLSTVDPLLQGVAVAIGLDRWHRLRYVELPLATPMIIAGVRTAAVINIGTATLAAFVGAGGLGEFIVTGLALNQTTLILMGAIPAAALAIATELLFECVEILFIPAHLRPSKLTE